MQAAGVSPLHSVHRGHLHGRGRGPEPAGVNDLGLAKTVHGFGEGVIVRIPDGPDRRGDTIGCQCLDLNQADVLNASLGAVDKPPVPHAGIRAQQRVSKACSGSACVYRVAGTAQPTILPVQASVMNATKAEPGQDPHRGDVSNPQPVRPLHGELPLDRSGR